MNGKQFKELVNLIPDTTEVELFHNVYCGGGDEKRFDNNIVLLTDGNFLIVTLEYYEHSVKSEFNGQIERVENL